MKKILSLCALLSLVLMMACAPMPSGNAKKPLVIHTVFFWVKKDLSPTDRAELLKGIESLRKIESIKAFWTGKAAATPQRDVVDASYDYALILHFDDVAGHDAYQIHPIHEAFVKKCTPMFAKVTVYDTQIQ
jgi:hypothetical protein